MSSQFGLALHVSLFGQSHGTAVGAVIDGFPAGLLIDQGMLSMEMNRRRPGSSALTTSRNEEDKVEFLSGVFRERTTGQPICLIIRSKDMHSEDYGEILDCVRPSHADYTGHIRYYGFEDFRGGGSFSGRLTAPLVAAGELCRQWLSLQGVRIESHIRRIGNVWDTSLESVQENDDLSGLRTEQIPVIDKNVAALMKQEVAECAGRGDSVGGMIEGRIVGLPAGLGAPFFDSVESELSHLFFSVPGVKGVSFGSGFSLSGMHGSEANDCFRYDGNRIVTVTNHSGGINGGVTNGMPVLYTCAIRPTPSIGKEQKTVSLRTGQETVFSIKGRHDPCIVIRAAAVMDAMTAIGILDLWKERAACVHS